MAESIHAAGGALDITLVSQWDLSGKQYFGVISSPDADLNTRISSLAGTNIVGIVQNKPQSGRPARVRIYGESKAVAGTAITRGTRVDVDAGGYMRTAVSSNYAGIALKTVVASATFTMIVNPQYAGA